jgi:hypothetical protein
MALVLVFDSGLVTERTSELSRGAQMYVASAVGVKVGVAPNEVNVLTARITELETELAAKDREITVALDREVTTPTPPIDTSTFILSIILFILLVLIVMNYILDYLRDRPVKRSRMVVS